jgi:V-type H+-transporting ATPase subunit F
VAVIGDEVSSKNHRMFRISMISLCHVSHIHVVFPARPNVPQDTVTGFLLAGVGHRTADSCNFLTVKQDTKADVIENTLKAFTQRDDIGIILINQHVANNLRHILKDYNQTIPTILEIPSKEHPYDPEQDFIMQRVNMFLGGGA